MKNMYLCLSSIVSRRSFAECYNTKQKMSRCDPSLQTIIYNLLVSYYIDIRTSLLNK